jgi:hypothetical protein
MMLDRLNEAEQLILQASRAQAAKRGSVIHANPAERAKQLMAEAKRITKLKTITNRAQARN